MFIIKFTNLCCTIVGNRPIGNPTLPATTQVRIYMRTSVPVKQDDDIMMMIMMITHWAESSLRGLEWPKWVEYSPLLWNLKVHCRVRNRHWGRWTQSIPSHSLDLRSDIMLFSHVKLAVVFWGFPTQFTAHFLFPFCCSIFGRLTAHNYLVTTLHKWTVRESIPVGVRFPASV